MSRNHFSGVFPVIALTFCFMADISVYTGIKSEYAYYVMALFVVLAAFKYVVNRCHFTDRLKGNVILFYFMFNFMSKVVIYGYSLVLLFLGLTEKRFISTNIQTFINGLSAISVFYLFGAKAFDYSCLAVIFAYIAETAVGISQRGLGISLEYHDLAFSVGYIILYILYKKIYKLKKGFVILTFAILMAVWAGKRIGWLALFCTVIAWIMMTMLRERSKKQMMFWSGIIIMAFCFLFLQFTMNPGIREIASALSVGMSGREYYYEALQPYVRNEITFLGLGRNAVQVIMTEDFPWFHVGNVHSDIFRMYAECGFILFFLWLLWYLIIMVRSTIKKFGTSVGEFVFLLTVYTFIVYFTDNTELYLMNQYFYILAMLIFSYEAKSRGVQREKRLQNEVETKQIQ